jgi:hypothetical protein
MTEQSPRRFARRSPSQKSCGTGGALSRPASGHRRERRTYPLAEPDQFGVLPLTIANPADYDRIAAGATLRIDGVLPRVEAGPDMQVQFEGSETPIPLRDNLSPHQIDMLVAGGAINWRREQS